MAGSLIKRLVPVLALAVALAAALLALAGFVSRSSAGASAMPADHVEVNGAAPDVFGPQADTVLLNKYIRTSTTADLVLDVTAECSIVTDVVDNVNTNTNNSTQGQIKIWITVDGRPVPVSSDDTVDPGKVVFCDRTFAMDAKQFSADENAATIETYDATRDANGFNWVALNVGNGIHHVVVHGELISTSPACSATAANPGATGSTCSEAVVGKRTLIIDPTHMAPNATTENLGP